MICLSRGFRAKSPIFKHADPSAQKSLQWRHNGRCIVSNYQPHDFLLNRWFRRRSKKTSKLRVTGFCVGNSPGTGGFPAQKVSKAENISIRWRHHACNFIVEAKESTFRPTHRHVRTPGEETLWLVWDLKTLSSWDNKNLTNLLIIHLVYLSVWYIKL